MELSISFRPSFVVVIRLCPRLGLSWLLNHKFLTVHASSWLCPPKDPVRCLGLVRLIWKLLNLALAMLLCYMWTHILRGRAVAVQDYWIIGLGLGLYKPYPHLVWSQLYSLHFYFLFSIFFFLTFNYQWKNTNYFLYLFREGSEEDLGLAIFLSLCSSSCPCTSNWVQILYYTILFHDSSLSDWW